MSQMQWKQYAEKHGLQFENGRVFGWRDGFFFTLSRRKGRKRLHVLMPQKELDQGESPTDEKQLQVSILRRKAVQALVETLQEFSLMRTEQFSDNGSISIEFEGDLDDVIRMERFLDDVFARFVRLGVRPEKICRHCQALLDNNGIPVQYAQDVYPLHEGCATAVASGAAENKQIGGNLLTGLLGAGIGATIGAILWAILYMQNFITSLAGIFTGFLVSWGYRLLRGPRGRIIIVVVIVFVIISVILGEVGAVSYLSAQHYNEMLKGLTANESMTITPSQYIRLVWQLFLSRPEYIRILLRDIGLGLLFSFLGCVGMLRKFALEASTAKPRRLTSTL